MKRQFKVEKLPLDTLINLLIELYESGIDYVDLSADNSDPIQDKLIIQTKDAYINPNYGDITRVDEDRVDEFPKKPPTIETQKLTEDDINDLIP